MSRWGLWSTTTRDFLTYGGRILVHDNQGEMEFLFPGAPLRQLPLSIPPDQTLPIALHPDLASVTWPLTRSQFR